MILLIAVQMWNQVYSLVFDCLRGYPHQSLSQIDCMQNARSLSQLYLDICHEPASRHKVYYYLALALYFEIRGATSVQASKCRLFHQVILLESEDLF